MRSRLKALGLEDDSGIDEIVNSMTTFLENKVKEKIGESRDKLFKAAEITARRDIFLAIRDQSVVIWSPNGKLEFISAAARKSLALKEESVLSAELLKELENSSFPLEEPPSQSSAGHQWNEGEVGLLIAIESIVRDDEENIIGALLGGG